MLPKNGQASILPELLTKRVLVIDLVLLED